MSAPDRKYLEQFGENSWCITVDVFSQIFFSSSSQMFQQIIQELRFVHTWNDNDDNRYYNNVVIQTDQQLHKSVLT